MKTIVIHRKDGTVRIMKVDQSAKFQNLGRDIDGENFLRQDVY